MEEKFKIISAFQNMEGKHKLVRIEETQIGLYVYDDEEPELADFAIHREDDMADKEWEELKEFVGELASQYGFEWIEN